MENTEIDSKKTSGQLSFKTSKENRLKLEKEANDLGLSLSEYLRIRMESPTNASEFSRIPKLIDKKTEKPAIDYDLKDVIREFMESVRRSEENGYISQDLQNTTNELLGQLIQKVSAPETAEEFSDEGQIEQAVAAALNKQMAENMIIRFTPEQKEVILNLIQYRREKGEIDCKDIESFFYSLIKEKFYGAWFSTVPDNFNQVFEKAFSEYLNPKDDSNEDQ